MHTIEVQTLHMKGVSIAITYGLNDQGVGVSPGVVMNFLFSTVKPPLQPTQLPIKWVLGVEGGLILWR